jgi:hypothetical protein
MGEDGPHSGRVLDDGDDPQPAATAGARRGHRGRTRGASAPPRSTRPGCRRGGGWHRLRAGSGRGWAVEADDRRTPASMRGEDAVIYRQVESGPGRNRRELLHELDGFKHQMGHPIAPHRLEYDKDAAVGTETDAVLGERGAEQIATELFEARSIVGGDPDVGVEVEAIELGVAGAAGGHVTSPRRRPPAPARGPRATRPWTEALTIPARTGEIALRGSRGALSSSGSSWRRVRRRGARGHTRPAPCGTGCDPKPGGSAGNTAKSVPIGAPAPVAAPHRREGGVFGHTAPNRSSDRSRAACRKTGADARARTSRTEAA